MAFVEVLLCIEAEEIKEEQEWQRMSFLLSLIHNVNSSREHQSTPDDYNPFAIQRRKNTPPAEIDDRKRDLFSRMQKMMNHG